MKEQISLRLKAHQEKRDQARKSSNDYSLLRGISFLIFVGSIIGYLSTLQNGPVWFLLMISTIILFIWSLQKHGRASTLLSSLEAQIHLTRLELQRIDLQFDGIEDGADFIEPDHPYQIDLDIFGHHSLFQLLNRCQIPDSKQLLANWLSAKASITEISQRQEAVQELAKDQSWFEEFQAAIKIELDKKQKRVPWISQHQLIEWAQTPNTIRQSKSWKSITILITMLSTLLILLVTFTTLPSQWLYLLIPVNGLWLYHAAKKLNEVSRGIGMAYYLISSFSTAMKMIEDRRFKSEKLKYLQGQLLTNDWKASESIASLSKLTHRLAARANMVYLILDLPFLLDAYLLSDLIQWKENYSSQIKKWFEIVNEVECLISIAGFSRSNPEFHFPIVDKKPFHFSAENLGHPLIPIDEKVTNNYQISGKGHIDIITGSNMSGKSTFERTIGINMVLAQMGAPVNATSLKMGLTTIFTSMRTTDDLSKHTSSFYAELKRIQQLLKTCEEHESTFFILDELLKGTNSDDRHKGAVALIKKLSLKPAFGLISTHDLALGKEGANIQNIRNFSFNSEIKNDEIIFDYKLSEGLCKSFNASKLM